MKDIQRIAEGFEMRRIGERTNAITELPWIIQREVTRICRHETQLHQKAGTIPCALKGHACFNCQDRAHQYLKENGL